MAIDRSELSSLAELLDQLTRRIGSMAEMAASDPADSVSPELYTIERALKGAHRRVERLARQVR